MLVIKLLLKFCAGISSNRQKLSIMLFTDNIAYGVLFVMVHLKTFDVFDTFQLEDYIPEVEEFYRRNHSGRKLQWHHLMSNGVVSEFFF